MQNIVIKLIRIVFQTLERLAPPISNRLALWFFFRPIKVPRPRRERPALETAKRTRRPLTGFYKRPPLEQYYETYEWGEGPPVLLVHGWGGRGSQFHQLVSALVEAGYKAVTFDAPAHGDSPGSRTNLLEFGEILRDLSQLHGEFQGIVAHSFGAVASARALVLDQLPARRLAIIGAPANMDFIFAGFSSQIQITERSLHSIKAFLTKLATRDLEEFSLVTHLPALKQPLLIVHDKDDRSVEVVQSQVVAEVRPDAARLTTSGLGHNRILSDPTVIEQVLDFVAG